MRHIIQRACCFAGALLCVALAACGEATPFAPLRGGHALASAVSSGTWVLAATAISPARIDLAWPDNADNESGYEIQRSPGGSSAHFTVLASLAANVLAYSDVGLAPTTQYCFRVRSFRINGSKTTYSSFSTSPCVTTMLDAPSGADVVPLSSSAVRVTWAPSSGAATSYRVERSADVAGPWTLAATTLSSVTSYTDVARTSETVVCYRIIGVSAQSESAPSNTDCTTPPATPTNLAAAVSDVVSLTWQDNSSVEDQYDVQRSLDGTTFTALVIVPANSIAYRDANVLRGSTYWYRVAARKDGGTSDLSSTARATVPTLAELPNAPSNTNALPENSSTVRVSWNDNSTNETGFLVEQANTVDGPWTPSGTAASNATSIALSVTSDTRVCYHVIATSASGASSPSSPDCTAAPAAPTNLVATPATDGIDLTWNDNSAVEFGYTVQISTDGATFTNLARLYAGATGYHQAGVLTTTTYTYRVAALRDGGMSDPSNTSAATGACEPTSDTEVCDNGVDDNCDGLVDTADYACVEPGGQPCGSGQIAGPGDTCVSSCDDGWRDSDESDVDCGGGCARCQVDQQCWGNWDCASNRCVFAPGAYMGVCQAPVPSP
jgi:hypothetical protein